MKSCSLGWHWWQIFTENLTISYSGAWNISSEQKEKAVNIQGRSQERVSGVLEPPFWVMKNKDIISRGKKYQNPPFEI